MSQSQMTTKQADPNKESEFPELKRIFNENKPLNNRLDLIGRELGNRFGKVSLENITKDRKMRNAIKKLTRWRAEQNSPAYSSTVSSQKCP